MLPSGDIRRRLGAGLRLDANLWLDICLRLGTSGTFLQFDVFAQAYFQTQMYTGTNWHKPKVLPFTLIKKTCTYFLYTI